MDDFEALEILFELAKVVVDPNTQFLQQLIDDVEWRKRRFPIETERDTLFDTACKHWSKKPYINPKNVKEAFRIVTFLIELEKRKKLEEKELLQSEPVLVEPTQTEKEFITG